MASPFFISETYSREALELRKADGFHEQIWMSMNLCRDFAQNFDGFIERVFKAFGATDHSSGSR